VAEAFLGRGKQPQAAARVGAQARDVAPFEGDACPGREALARQRGEQLVLAVAGDPADAQHLARAQLKDVAQRVPKGRGQAEPRDVEQHRPASPPVRWGTCSVLPTIISASSRRGLFARVAGGDHLAQPQHRRVFAERADLFELVADVEDRGAFLGELPQRVEQDLHLLRGQHRGGLVHDQQLRVLQQAADDLDPLALAGGQIAHQPVGVERQAVAFPSSPRGSGAERARRGAGRPSRARCSRPRSSASNSEKC
jgi:hypothetical protein